MKKSFQIFKRDLGRLFRNRAAVLILVGISVLPSLYAWFNIAANMDPYGNTKGIQVAIANEDKGADSEQMSLDAGQNIVDNLKKNDQLGWKFVDAKEAKKGVRSGKYYAAIVIPDNFSESLLSILSGDIKQPKLDYYINEKKNAIAPKITDTGASTIQQEINDTFTSVAAESISELLSKEAGELSGKVSEENSSLIKAIADTRKNLDEYNKVLENFQKTVDKSDEIMASAVSMLDQVTVTAESGAKAIEDSGNVLADTRTAVGQFSTEFSNGLSNGETLLNDTYVSASAKLGVFETKAGQALTAVDNSLSTASSLLDKNQELLEQLKELNDKIQGHTELGQQISAVIGQKITELENQNASLQELVSSLKTGNQGIQNAVTTAKNTRTSLEKLAKESKDSEHSAIFQSLQGNDHGALHKILLTASGGPFRGKKSEELMEIKVEDALKHPNWSMGRKITIDSSTMVNKGLEVIEAKWLFNVDVDQVQVVVQPQSIIHSMVEYVDGAIIAELGTPDMKLPIQYALYYPERRFLPGDRVDFWTLGKLEFEKPDTDTFYGLELAYEAGRKGGSLPTVFNAANELAVSQFLNREIKYLEITEIIEDCMKAHKNIENPTLEQILETEAATYERINSRR